MVTQWIDGEEASILFYGNRFWRLKVKILSEPPLIIWHRHNMVFTAFLASKFVLTNSDKRAEGWWFLRFNYSHLAVNVGEKLFGWGDIGY